MTDLEALAGQLMRPRRDGLADALACVLQRTVDPAALPLDAIGLRGFLDVKEAWEALASRGVIPMAWVESPGRRFMANGMTMDRPVSLRAAVALASDVAGVSQAEALAWEAVARAEPWGGARPSRVVWSVRTDARARSLPWSAELTSWIEGDGTVTPTVRAALAALGTGLSGRGDWPDAHLDVRPVITAWVTWRARVAAGETVTSPWLRAHPGVYGRSVADLSDPFEPVLGVWSLGYALGSVTPTAVHLVAPDL